jgi:hypothetical protein
LQDSRVNKVYSVFPVWQNSLPLSDKFVDGIPEGKSKDLICIGYDNLPKLENLFFKSLLINTCGPSCDPYVASYQKLVSDWKQYYKSKFVCTHGYFIPGEHDRFASCMGEEYLTFLPLPVVPKVYPEANNFDCNILSWVARDIIADIRTLPSDYSTRPFRWIASKLEQDSKKEFHIVTGIQRFGEFKNYTLDNFYGELYSSPVTRCLLPFKDRITAYIEMDWSAVMELFGRTKLGLGPWRGSGFYNPTIELGSFGTPTLGNFAYPEVPVHIGELYNTDKYYELLDKLYSDKVFYTETGNAYRDFINQHHTYKAFADNLFKLLSSRQML